jgi:prepilin-type N-terminal cleavage/methylation domain-containing protein
MNMKKNNSGFTLLELMIVVAISGVLLMAGIPAFRSMITTNQITSKTNDLIMSLKLARSTAITSGHTASVCSSTDGATCTGVNGQWANGWIVWVDLDNSGDLDVAAGATELIWVKQIDANSTQSIIPSNNFAQQVDFRFDGTLLQAIVGSFQICSGAVPATDGFPPRNINLSVSGEPQFTKDTTPGNEC